MNHTKKLFRLIMALALFAVLLIGCGVEQGDMTYNSLPQTDGAEDGATETSGSPEESAGTNGGTDQVADDADGTVDTDETDGADASEGTDAAVDADTEQDADTGGNGLVKAVFADARQASEGLNSFSVQMNMKQRFTYAGTTDTIASKIDMDAILQPSPTIRMKTSVGLGQDDYEMTMIMTETSLYMHEPISDMWMEWPAEMAMDLGNAMTTENMNPMEQLEQIAPYLDAFHVEETAEGYRLQMETSDDNFRGLLAAQLANQGDLGVLSEMEEMWEKLTVHRLAYDFLVDKDNHLLKSMNVFMDFTMEVEGEKTDMVLEMDGIYANYNNVADIPLPDNAMSLEDMGYGF